MPFTAKPGAARRLRSTRGVWMRGSRWWRSRVLEISRRARENRVTCPRPRSTIRKPRVPATAVIAAAVSGRAGVFQHTRASSRRFRLLGGAKSTADSRKSKRPDRPRRVGADRFRSQRDLLGDILRFIFGRARSTELTARGRRRTQYARDLLLDASQQRIAQAYILPAGQGACFRGPIVTRLDPLKGFYPPRPITRLPRSQPELPVHRDQRTCEDREPERLFPDQYRRSPS